MRVIRVFAEALPSTVGRAMHRVSAELKKWAPQGIEFTTNLAHAELQIIQYWCSDCGSLLTRKDIPYCVIYHCKDHVYESPITGMPADYIEKALMVASWQPLPEGDKYHWMPLGADPTIWHPEPGTPANYKVCTTGYVADSESLWEIYHAVRSINGRMIHIGGKCISGEGLDWAENVPDQALRAFYCQSEYVSGLRRQEGWELPLVEGLFCGIRGLVYDRLDQTPMRKFCLTIHEDTPESVEAQLREVLSQPPKPITEEERQEIVATLSWEPIAKAFWKALLARL